MRRYLLGLVWVGSIFGWYLFLTSATIASAGTTPAPADDATSDSIHESTHVQSDVVKAFRKTALAVTFPSNGLQLRGWVYKPASNGRFPAIVWNHSSEKNPSARPELGLFCTQHGYAFFVPVRHGHNPSPGEYFGNTIQEYIASGEDRAAIQKKVVALAEESNEDVVAALAWLKQQSYVTPNEIGVAGVGYGGLQALLLAERGLDLRACIAFSPAAMSWANREIRQRAMQAVQSCKVPIFLLQAENDYSLGPSDTLGLIIREKGGANQAKVYPAFGTTHAEGEIGFACWEEGVKIWGSDFLDFLKAAGMPEAGSQKPGVSKQ
jgi:carboxymethylenebutenolidase